MGWCSKRTAAGQDAKRWPYRDRRFHGRLLWGAKNREGQRGTLRLRRLRSDLRAGGWDALDALAMEPDVRAAVAEAKLYDQAMSEYPGFMASRRNYDIGQGIDSEGRPRSGVFESILAHRGRKPR